MGVTCILFNATSANRSTSPVSTKQSSSPRIHNVDTLRGAAVMGILTMNAVSFGLGFTSYFNISFDTAPSTVARSIAIVGEVVADQKFMALFSILFGAGIVLFCERLSARLGHTKAIRISWWRNTLLLFMGIIHSAFWEGDVLLIYAVIAPVILALRNLSSAALLLSGLSILSLSPLSAWLVQQYADSQPLAAAVVWGEYWVDSAIPVSDSVGLWIIGDAMVRALGMMLIGIHLYRSGFLTGACSKRLYVAVAVVGTATGWILAASGVAWLTIDGFSTELALVAGIPNTLGTLPAALGYIAIITLLAQHVHQNWHDRINAIGRMALTNYLTQTAFGLIMFNYVLDTEDVSRITVVMFVLSVWIIQLWWSKRWLDQYTQGPLEWLWRCATHRQWLQLRRDEVGSL